MSISLIILEDSDIVTTDLWCRPLQFECMQFGGGNYHQTDEFGGLVNTYKWVNIGYYFGECWIGKTVKELNDATSTKYELVSGNPPNGHYMSDKDVKKIFKDEGIDEPVKFQ